MIFQEAKKFDKDPKEIKIDELCKQVEKLYLKMIKQPRQAPKQGEPVCYKCAKKCHYALQCSMAQIMTCYKCCENDHRASKWRSKVDIPHTCTYCYRPGHTDENCSVKRSNEPVEKQDVRFAKNSQPTKAEGVGPSRLDNVMFVKEDASVEEYNTVAAFKRSADGKRSASRKGCYTI